eukprot:463194_1
MYCFVITHFICPFPTFSHLPFPFHFPPFHIFPPFPPFDFPPFPTFPPLRFPFDFPPFPTFPPLRFPFDFPPFPPFPFPFCFPDVGVLDGFNVGVLDGFDVGVLDGFVGGIDGFNDG